jgi:transcriptional regulator with XRE-family HTH domain
MDEKILLRQFGQRVREIRKQQNFSQEELAERCNLHRTYIGGIERGERNLALVNIARIAKALEVDMCVLLEGLST